MALSSYQEALDYLYANLPIFQRVGAAAYKKDLHNTIQLCQDLDNPQHKFRSVHAAGTNGKGSTSHLLASVLQSAGYKTGLYTSPHLKEFTERIRINGREIEREFVVDFVNRIQPSIEKIQPSFFEITVAMAYDYFAQQQVDIAIIEVGLGGRLDSTNVITPLVSVITNISWDHQDILGDTLEKIAFEKAGIIKRNVPAIVSEKQTSVESVFVGKAAAEHAPLYFAGDEYQAHLDNGRLVCRKNDVIVLDIDSFPLMGSYQERNIPGVLRCIDELVQLGFVISRESIERGFRKVTDQTGLKGRWQKIGSNPTVYCDTGHNEAGVKEVVAMIRRQTFRTLLMVIGMVKDKDISKVLSLLPKEGYYFFCQAKIPRAMDAVELQKQAGVNGLHGEVIPDVNEALAHARAKAQAGDFIFVGGSTFVVAELNDI